MIQPHLPLFYLLWYFCLVMSSSHPFVPFPPLTTLSNLGSCCSHLPRVLSVHFISSWPVQVTTLAPPSVFPKHPSLTTWYVVMSFCQCQSPPRRAGPKIEDLTLQLHFLGAQHALAHILYAHYMLSLTEQYLCLPQYSHLPLHPFIQTTGIGFPCFYQGPCYLLRSHIFFICKMTSF